MSIQGRLRKLERDAGGRPCPSCGFPPDARGRIVISGEPGFPENPDERCGACGRHLYTVILIVEDGAEPPRRGDIVWP